jgi:hypothetical protein
MWLFNDNTVTVFMSYRAMTRRCFGSIALLALLLFSGCSQGARSLKLDKDVAHKSFEQFLTAWRDGKSQKDLQAAQPSIICTDFQFMAGLKLKNFKVIDKESSDGTNLRLSAELTIAAEGQPDSTETVEYIVGTSPVITISRP